MGYSPWGRKESDKTEAISHTYLQVKFQVISFIISKINNIKGDSGDDSGVF